MVIVISPSFDCKQLVVFASTESVHMHLQLFQFKSWELYLLLDESVV
jgi:hypothetical protein